MRREDEPHRRRLPRIACLALVALTGCDDGRALPFADTGDGGTRASTDLAAGGPSQAADLARAPSPPGMTAVPCPDRYRSECWTLSVPLDWSQGEESQPRIDILVAREASHRKSAGQLWLLNGGPGGAGADYYELIEYLAQIAPDLDLYTLDHRGTGHSARLGCPKSGEAPGSPSGRYIADGEWPRCIAELKATWGEGLRQFTTTNAAHDLAAAISATRRAGQDAHVLGVSYGTYWGLRYLQLHPSQPTSVVLDSIAPPGDALSTFDADFDKVGRQYLDLCKADKGCAARLGPDPQKRVAALLDKLDGGHCAELFGGEPARPLTRQLLGSLLMGWESRVLSLVLAYRLERCEHGDMQAIADMLDVIYGDQAEDDGTYSTALGHHVGLSELWEQPPPSQAQLVARTDAALYSVDVAPAMGALYESWPRYARDQWVGKWPATSVPVLMMNGTLDPQTLYERAKESEKRLAAPGQVFVTFPGSPHCTISQSPMASGLSCGLQVALGFLADPRGALDTSCTRAMLPVSFEVDRTTSRALIGVDDIWDGMPGSPRSLRQRPIDWQRVLVPPRPLRPLVRR